MNGAKVEYSKSLDRPFFSMSLHDASGKRLEPVQDTPPGHFDRRTFIITAGHDLQFKTPMRQIPPGEGSLLDMTSCSILDIYSTPAYLSRTAHGSVQSQSTIWAYCCVHSPSCQG